MNEESIKSLKEKVLELEKTSLSNIIPIEDKQMIAKIMKLYEEQKNDNK